MTPVTKTNYLIELNKALDLAIKINDKELQILLAEQIKLVIRDAVSKSKK